MSGATEVVPFGDRALRFDLPAGRDRRVLLDALRAASGVIDVVLAEEIGAVMVAEEAALAPVAQSVREILRACPSDASTTTSATKHVVRVVYDGLDLPALAARLGVGVDDVVAMHAGREYEVAMVGFLPGFAYLRGLDPRLVVERRAEPRARVPAGSVAVAAEYTGIYPFVSPGGWHLLGEAIDHRALGENGATFGVGDRVRFERADRAAATDVKAKHASPSPPAPAGPHLEVRRAQGPAIVVDSGRTGHMHDGVPPGGPMVLGALARANAAAGNAPGAAAIELYGLLEVTARGGSVTVADDLGRAAVLEDGASFVVATEGRTRVRYLAVRGGLDVPLVLGSRSTLLAAHLGGLEGRPLKRGDRLAALGRRSAAQSPSSASPVSPCVRCEFSSGPDATPEITTALGGATFTISAASDRIGTRLEGDLLPPGSMHIAANRKSTPMVRGAVEMTPRGLVVLGPDHPTTGGYPVIAVVRSEALGRLLAAPVGARVQLVKHAANPT